MGKKQGQPSIVGQQKQKNKSHKTLREKLRKKRANEKVLLKQKKQKKKLFDPESSKKQFFFKHFNSNSEQKYKQAKKLFKYKKIKKCIEKIINVYQDDLQDFFTLFKQFDDGGFINISGLQNKKLYNIMLKLFHYLPLNQTQTPGNKPEIEFRKKKDSTWNLEALIRSLVTDSIQNYMENGTEDQNDEKVESSDEETQKKLTQLKKSSIKKKITVNIRNQDKETIFTLPKLKAQTAKIDEFGPMISEQERLKIEEVFDKQLEQMEKLKKAQNSNEEDQFDQIFNLGQTSNKLRKFHEPPAKLTLEDFPAQLLAEGSAQIGQKMTINQDEQKQYDAIHRPKKLIDQHRQIMAINRGDEPGPTKFARRPFDRQRDVVNSSSRMTAASMSNAVFFNFKDKMTAPKKTNSFL